jgi:hypothetical protein
VNYIDWCERVLAATTTAHSKSGSMRSIGVDEHRIAAALFSENDAMASEFHSSAERIAMLDAIRDLTAIGLLDENASQGFYQPSSMLTQLDGDLLPLWRHVCGFRLTAEQEALLRAIAPMSETVDDGFTGVEWVEHDDLLRALACEGLDDAWHVAKALDDAGLIRWSATMGAFKAHVTYRGLVWLRKQGETVEAELIDQLVAEWETTSVEFKRELRTGTVDEKAELVKDLTALANTQASGRRWLIVGFDAKTHEHIAAPDPAISQDHLEQLISAYIEPSLTVRYSATDYRSGTVGKLEVIREAAKLPYVSKRELQAKRHVSAGQWFVRHGSQVEEPTPAERQAIIEEAARARGER